MGQIADAVRVLARGGLVAFPTETVYGLGADATNEAAVLRIFQAKRRPTDHPLIVHLAHVDQLREWARVVPDAAMRLAAAFWPGPMTLILPKTSSVSSLVTGGQDTVGLRIPSHPVAQAMLQAFGRGVAGPSANRFGHVSPTTAAHVRAEFGDELDLVLDGGQSEVGIESTIIDVSTDEIRLLRPGMIAPREIESVVGRPVRSSSASAPRVSGSLPSHYAPATPATLVDCPRLEVLARDGRSLYGVLALTAARPAGFQGCWIDAPAAPAAYAHDLYANLRRLDDSGCEAILIESVPDTPEWLGVRDRVTRAATPREPEGT